MPQRDSAREPLLGHHSGSSHENLFSGGFAYTVEDLAPLTDPTNPKLPHELGGIEKICQGLRVDPRVGLHSDEAAEHSFGKICKTKFADRSKAFGRNVSPSFLRCFPCHPCYQLSMSTTDAILVFAWINPTRGQNTLCCVVFWWARVQTRYPRMREVRVHGPSPSPSFSVPPSPNVPMFLFHLLVPVGLG